MKEYEYPEISELFKENISENENENKSIFSFNSFLNPGYLLENSFNNKIFDLNPYEQLDNSDNIPNYQINPEIPKKKLFIEISKNETQEKSNIINPKKNQLLGKKNKKSFF